MIIQGTVNTDTALVALRKAGYVDHFSSGNDIAEVTNPRSAVTIVVFIKDGLAFALSSKVSNSVFDEAQLKDMEQDAHDAVVTYVN